MGGRRREGGRDGGREGGRDGGREGGKVGGKENPALGVLCYYKVIHV